MEYLVYMGEKYINLGHWLVHSGFAVINCTLLVGNEKHIDKKYAELYWDNKAGDLLTKLPQEGLSTFIFLNKVMKNLLNIFKSLNCCYQCKKYI